MRTRQWRGLADLPRQVEGRWQSSVHTSDLPGTGASAWALATLVLAVPVSLQSDLPARHLETLLGLNLLPWANQPVIEKESRRLTQLALGTWPSGLDQPWRMRCEVAREPKRDMKAPFLPLDSFLPRYAGLPLSSLPLIPT